MALLVAMCDAVAFPAASLFTSGIRHCAIVMSPLAVGCSPSPSSSCKGPCNSGEAERRTVMTLYAFYNYRAEHVRDRATVHWSVTCTGC